MGEQYEITSNSCSNVATTLANANSYTITNANSYTITDGDLYTISDVFKYQMPQYYFPDNSYLTTISGTSPGTCNNLVEDPTILKINIKKKSIKLNFAL